MKLCPLHKHLQTLHNSFWSAQHGGAADNPSGPPPAPTCFFFASSSLFANSGSVRRLNRMATLVPLSMGSRGSFLNLQRGQRCSTNFEQRDTQGCNGQWSAQCRSTRLASFEAREPSAVCRMQSRMILAAAHPNPPHQHPSANPTTPHDTPPPPPPTTITTTPTPTRTCGLGKR